MNVCVCVHKNLSVHLLRASIKSQAHRKLLRNDKPGRICVVCLPAVIFCLIWYTTDRQTTVGVLDSPSRCHVWCCHLESIVGIWVCVFTTQEPSEEIPGIIIMEVLSTSLEKGLAALAKLYNFTRRRKLLSVLLYLACKSADLGGRVVFWEHTMFLSVQLWELNQDVTFVFEY